MEASILFADGPNMKSGLFTCDAHCRVGLLASPQPNRANPVEELWVYGWTHYGKTGQTRARMNKLTREVEIKERKQWLKCWAGCDDVFTSRQVLRNKDRIEPWPTLL